MHNLPECRSHTTANNIIRILSAMLIRHPQPLPLKSSLAEKKPTGMDQQAQADTGTGM